MEMFFSRLMLGKLWDAERQRTVTFSSVTFP
jgi:hypothetical protein